jgi:Ser/Thr protein kinase RdoA (MazF antagonist)
VLSPAVTPGLATDPALGSRDVLLDPDAVATLLAGSIGSDGQVDITSCELLRVKYRIGESLRVLYRISVDGRQQLVAGRAFRGGDAVAAHAKAARDAVDTRTLRPVVLHAELDTVWWTFPNDRRLRTLDALVHPPRELPDFAAAADGWTSSEVAQYAPERSVTLQALDAREKVLAYVKAYAPATLAVDELAARYDIVAERLGRQDSSLRSPRSIGHSARRNVLLLEAMPGASWLGLEPTAARDALHRLGRCIATLHTVPADDLRRGGIRRFARLDLTRLGHAARLIAQARPDVADSAIRLAVDLESTQCPPEQHVPLHGDCHPGNLLVGEASVALIDLDQAGTGPAAADLGSLIARLHYGTIVGERDADTTADLASAFLDGYSQVRPMPGRASLRWHTAAALLGERALRAVNRAREPALAHLDELLSLGNAVLMGDALMGRQPR